MTELEKYFRGSGGNQYTQRNSEESLGSYLNLFSKMLSRTGKIDSIIDYGSNIGHGLKALNILLPKASLTAVEINEAACVTLKEYSKTWRDSPVNITILNKSVIGFKDDIKADLVTEAGLLMYIDEEYLPDVYETYYRTSKKYIFLAEYYNPTPMQIKWRDAVLYKRDFAGEMLDMFPALNLIDYGFIYHRDNHFPADDSTWFLLEKREC